MKQFIVEIEKDVWLAPWDGDPGRTLVKDNAKIFKNLYSAKEAIKIARFFQRRNFVNAKVVSFITPS